jgi:hypothetical protein
VLRQRTRLLAEELDGARPQVGIAVRPEGSELLTGRLEVRSVEGCHT